MDPALRANVESKITELEATGNSGEKANIDLLKKVLSGEVSFLDDRALASIQRGVNTLNTEIERCTKPRDSLIEVINRQNKINDLIRKHH